MRARSTIEISCWPIQFHICRELRHGVTLWVFLLFLLSQNQSRIIDKYFFLHFSSTWCQLFISNKGLLMWHNFSKHSNDIADFVIDKFILLQYHFNSSCHAEIVNAIKEQVILPIVFVHPYQSYWLFNF